MKLLRVVICVALIASAAVLSIGVYVERRNHETTQSTGEATHNESAEAHSEQAATSPNNSESKVLGLNAESPAIIVLALAVSLVVAALIWLRSRRATFGLGALVGTLFVIFDIAEIVHQLDRSDAGLATLAGAVIAGHTLVAVAAGVAFVSITPTDPSDARPPRLSSAI